MRADIIIPKIGMTMTDATIAEWLVAEGASVAAGEPVVAIETDKTTVDIEAAAAGVLRHGAEVGATLDAGSVIGWIEAQAE